MAAANHGDLCGGMCKKRRISAVFFVFLRAAAGACFVLTSCGNWWGGRRNRAVLLGRWRFVLFRIMSR